MGTLVEPKEDTMVYTPQGFVPYGALLSGMGYQDVKAIMDAQASDALLSQLETQLTPEQLEAQRLGLSVDQMKGDTEDMVRNILQFGGQDESNQLAINALVAGKAKQAGVPQPSQQDIVDYLADIGAQQEAAAANDPQSLLDKGIDVAQEGIETVQGGINTVGRKVGEGIDKVFEILNLPNPTKIIGAPVQKSGTVVWGQTGGSPVIGTGTTGAGTQTGVTTGNAGLDAILNRVTGVLTGKVAADEIINQDIIKEILVGQASEELGVSVDAVEDGIEGLNKVKDAVVPPTAYGVDLGKEPKIGSSGVEQLDVIGDMGDLDTVVKGTPPPESLSLIETTTPKVQTVGDLTPAAIPRTNAGTDQPAPEPKTPAVASESSDGGGGGGGGGFGTSSAGQRIVQTSPGELVDIDYLYNIAGPSIFAPDISNDEDIMPYIYNKGGPVQKFTTGGGPIDYLGGALNQDLGLTNNQNSKSFGSKVMDFLGDDKNQNLIGLIGGGLGGLLGMSGDTQSQGSLGYQGGIPDYKATRELVPNAFDNTGRRPGGAGRQYFTDVQYTPTSTTEGGLPAIIGAEQIAAQNAAYTEALAAQEADNIALANSFLGAIPTDTSTAATPVTPDTPVTPTTPTTPTTDSVIDFVDEFSDESPMGPVNPFPSYEAQLRSGEKTPNQLATDLGIEEEDLITRLINAGNTDVNEVLEYYSTLYPELYGNTTVADVNKYLYPDQYAQGGDINQYYLGGSTDGMADDIPAMIGNSQPAALSDGEFVIPADVVSHLGNGNSDAGAQNLYSMMDRVRKDRTGNPNQGKQIDPNQYLA